MSRLALWTVLLMLTGCATRSGDMTPDQVAATTAHLRQIGGNDAPRR